MVRKKEQNFQALSYALDTSENHAKQWQTYKCTLVTPMYGGGVKAGEVDTAMPIRASSIRGQLRFWWRIACGPFNSPKEMFDRETAIWGGIGDNGAKASQVEIRVTTDHSIKLIPSEKIVARNDKEGRGITYVLGAGDPAECLDSGFKFKISIYYHLRPNSQNPLTLEALKENVIQALRWWATFGGVGAKTRRGFGSVEVKENGEIITPVSPTEVKRGKLVLVSPKDKQGALACWKYGCDKLRDFRQGVDLARNPPAKESRSPAGQSRWPEADSIRNLSGDSYEEHKPKNPNLNLFPRAAFGLPIIFHFQKPKKLKKEDRNPEPKDHTVGIKGENNERMASPLILRPYLNKCGQWQSAALLLPKWEQALEVKLEIKNLSNLKNGKKNKYHHALEYWPSDPNQRQSLARQISPMKKKDGSLRGDDPLSAFLDYFEKGQ